MPFNIALSGIRAANNDLRVTGNNIANASTTGFKQSRTEFGDIYSTSAIGSGLTQSGSGVRVQEVSQQFSQGNISFTENALDLSVSGSGFFVTSFNGNETYTRSGAFGLDQDGYIVNNTNARLQGFSADSSGNISGLISDVQIQTSNIQPSATTGVETALNVDSREAVIQTTGTRYISSGGTAAADSNGYTAQSLDFTNPAGVTNTFTTTLSENSFDTVTDLNRLPGITAVSQATATLSAWTSGLVVTVNSAPLTNTGISQAAATEISGLPGLTATYDGTAGTIAVVSTIGDLIFEAAGSGAADQVLTLAGSTGLPQTLEYDGAGDLVGAGNLTAGVSNITVGGIITLELDEGYSVTDNSGTPIFDNASASFINNAFNPALPETYNHSTSVTIYDSLGNSHVMQQYFVKQPYDPTDASTFANHWQMSVQIDGANVGDPVISAPTTATMATYDLFFTANGTLDEGVSDSLLISNWTPTDSSGNALGALGPLNVASGGSTPVADPAISSNFEITMPDSTQVGSEFEVRALDQNGSTTGRLVGIDVDDSGIIFARYTNGENQILAQIGLADFPNSQGLQSLGDTSWAQTFDSGEPVIGGPGTASLGLIQSGALEDSNVDLSEQLVNLIIAQRNFQASAKTIETADTITQTIINLR